MAYSSLYNTTMVDILQITFSVAFYSMKNASIEMKILLKFVPNDMAWNNFNPSMDK